MTLVLYLFRFLVTFSVVVLWFVAMSDIRGHSRKGVFTTLELRSTAIAVSVVAIGAIAALHAAVPYGWTRPAPNAIADAPRIMHNRGGFSYGSTYVFGLERPTRVPQN